MREFLKNVNVGKVLIKPDEDKEKTDSGLYFATNAEKSSYGKGTVVYCGVPRTADGNNTAEEWFTGDRIYFSRLGAEEIKAKNGKLLLVRLEDVVGGLAGFEDGDESKLESTAEI